MYNNKRWPSIYYTDFFIHDITIWLYIHHILTNNVIFTRIIE